MAADVTAREERVTIGAPDGSSAAAAVWTQVSWLVVDLARVEAIAARQGVHDGGKRVGV